MIDSQHGRRVFVLQVAGLPIRYMSHDLNLSSSNLSQDIASGIPYQDRTGLVSVGALSGSLDPSGGIANYQGVSITLASRGARGDSTDPHVVFGRCGSRSNVTRAKLTQGIRYQQNPGILAYVDRDLTGALSAPCLVHIGAETFRCGFVNVGTLILTARAVGDSQRQAHEIALGGTNKPEVTAEITTFRGRRASLWAAHQYPDGALSDFVQVINGFIDNTPNVEEASEVSFSILPLTSLIASRTAATSVSTGLLQGFHYFGNMKNQLEWAWHLSDTSRVFIIASVSTVGTTTFLNFTENIENIADRVFDISLPSVADGFSRAHPRFPTMSLGDQGYFFEPISISGNTVAIDNTVTTYPFTSSNVVRFVSYPEIKRVTLGLNEIVEHPQCINDALVSVRPTDTQGVDGAWGRWSLDGKNISTTPTDDLTPFRASLLLWTGRHALTNSSYNSARYWNARAPYVALADRYRLAYPLEFVDGAVGDPSRPGEQRLIDYQLEQRGRTTGSSFDLGAVALAWYSLGEPVLLVEDSLGLPSSDTGDSYAVEIQFHDRLSGDSHRQWVVATHQTDALFDGNQIGYLIHLQAGQNLDQVRSFGDWSGQERCVLSVSARYFFQRPGELLLRLLESGGGGQKNGTYDVYTIGLGIPSSQINEDSFLSYDGANFFTLSGSLSSEDSDLQEIMEGILRMMGCAIVMAKDSSGLSKVTLQPIGAENARLIAANIGESDWIADPPPRWSTFEDIVTQVTFHYEWDEQEKEYTASRSFVNQEAINRYGGELKKIDVDVQGLQSEQVGGGAGNSFGFFLPCAARLFNLLSNPAREWVGSIGTGASMFLDVGSYVGVTSKHLKGYDDSFGVTNGIGFVKAIHQDLMGEGCQLEMMALGLRPVCWNATARVTATPTSSSVTIAAAQFSQDDASYFAAGDVVDYLPEGNEDGALTGLTILSVVGQTITFTANHGISASGGTLEPTTYASASATHKADAFMASNDALPVLGSDSAQEYA
jgi:hypothetical protein